MSHKMVGCAMPTKETSNTERNGKSAKRANTDSLMSSSTLIATTTHSLSSQTILKLQKTVGNQALQRLITHSVRSNTVNNSLLQRCGIGCKCDEPNDEKTRPVQQTPIKTNVPVTNIGWLQRTLGDDHDLRAPDIAGDTTLEACFDDERLLRAGNRGPAVEKLQNALLKLGFQLPRHGADGIFGRETRTAVENFQFVTGIEADGLVGPITMSRLDEALLRPAPPGPGGGPTPQDREITGVHPDAASIQSKIFFDRNSANPDDDPAKSTKIANLTQPANIGNALELKGIVSEDENSALATQRINAVDQLFRDARHTGRRTPNPLPGDGLDRLDYRSVRIVEMIPAGGSSTVSSCAPTAADPHPEIEPCSPATQFTDAQARAIQILDPVISAVSGTLGPTTEAAIDRFFGTTATTRQSAAQTIHANLVDLKQHIAVQMTPENPNGPGHRCGTDCDNTCSDSTAYNTGVDSDAVMVLCRPYMANPNVDARAETLIHEGAHGTEWAGAPRDSGADDFAYESQRLIHFLDTETALKNNDSYVFFIREINTPGSVPARDPNRDPKGGGMTAAEGEQVDRALAWLEGFVIKALQDLSGLYDEMDEAIRQGRWTDSYQSDSMIIVSRRFNLTRPLTAPTQQDKITVAAIHDRIQRMDRVLFDTQVNANKVNDPTTTWTPGPGGSVDVGQDFFNAPSERARLDILLHKIVEATSGISPNMLIQYVAMIDELRTHAGLGSP